MFPRFHVIARRPRLLVMSSASLLVALAAAPSFAERSSARSDTPPALVPLRSVSPAAVAPAATSSSAAAASGPVRVHLPGMSPCPPSAGPEPEFVWCFEGAGGDSTWPANPGGTSWRHWSRFAPPGPQSSRWHVTTKHGGVSGGTYNAWAGCDSVGTNPGCADVGFWVFQEGYGDDWNEVLEIQCSGQNTTSGGAIEFDLRYDAECVYDYLYLEYLDNGTGQWKPVLDGGGNAAVFNGTSGNPGAGCDNGGGGANEGNYFDDVGVYGSSSWYENVSFPLPAQAGDTHVRWRADSDPASSDQDGRADTDGLAAIDNLTLTFTADGATVTDDFETGDFLGVGASAGTAAWNRGLAGNTYDGWHLSFDPMYKGKGPTCLFDDTWMWAAKPDVGAIQEDQFDFFLVSPTIDVSGWSAGWVTWHGFQCDWTQSNHDLPTILVRVHDTALGWSPWEQFDGFLLFNSCEYSSFRYEDFTDYLTPSVDSLVIGWELRDLSQPGDFDWGQHVGTQYTVDNVTFSSYDGTSTVFTARSIDRFADTFSLSDPAHTPFLANAEQGDWVGSGGSRAFAKQDSLTVSITDIHGITASDVVLWWRHDDGGAGFGSWTSKAMDFALQDPTGTPGEGTYRQILGADDGGAEDLTAASDGRIWKAGTTVEYYLHVTDDLANVATYPAGAPAEAFDFSVLPFDNTSPAQGNAKILLVGGAIFDALDYELSTGFDPGGGYGDGNFDAPVFVPSVEQTAAALDQLGLVYDRYNVQGAGSSISALPRGTASSASGLGGFLTDGGAPYYDCIVWLQGAVSSSFSLPDTSRLELAQYLDAGGKLLIYGDEVAEVLASDDPTFLATYLGATLDAGTTAEKVLNAAGSAGGSLDGAKLGLYGECPLRRSFDRLALAAPAAGSANAAALEYADGAPADDGAPAAIRNTRTGPGGVAVLAGFDADALLYPESRACFLGAVLGSDLGITVPSPPACESNGTNVPPHVGSAGFELAAPAPNPAPGAVDVRFSTPSRGPVTVAVYDVAGRRVRTLLDGVLAAGTHVRVWDGRTDDGAHAANGVYFVRLQADGLTQTRKAALRR